MSGLLKEKTQTELQYERVLGHIVGEQPGPTVIAVGGLHGNEPSGVKALQTILEQLQPLKKQFKGEFLALSGNLRALQEGIRFVDHDLNRMWKLKDDARTLDDVPPGIYEAREMAAIQEQIDKALERRRGPLVLIDLHTTSSESPPFLLCGDTLRNRNFIKGMPVPKILGLDEMLNGPLLSYLNAQGHVTVCFEAGQHTSPKAYANHMAIVWMVMAQAGSLSTEQMPDYNKQVARLVMETTENLRGFFAVRYRHGIKGREDFKMVPGFRNFQFIHKDQHLASNSAGKVFSPQPGQVFMPLYQKQGDDGFFIVRRVSNSRVRISAKLRRMKIQNLLPLIPGIRRHPNFKGILVVHTRYIRYFGPAMLNMFGYRRQSRLGHRLLFIKRPFDLKGPSKLDKFRR